MNGGLGWAALGSVLGLALFCSGCCCFSELEQKEGAYLYNLEQLDDQIEALDGGDRDALERARRGFVERYEALPEETEARQVKLGKLNQEMNATITAYSDKVDEKQARTEAAAEAHQQELIGSYAGTWKGDGVTLTISPAGSVDYKKKKGNITKTVQAPITKFTDKQFEAGVLGVNTTFVINEPIRKEDGVSTMTLDGVIMTRQE